MSIITEDLAIREDKRSNELLYFIAHLGLDIEYASFEKIQCSIHRSEALIQASCTSYDISDAVRLWWFSYLLDLSFKEGENTDISQYSTSCLRFENSTHSVEPYRGEVFPAFCIYVQSPVSDHIHLLDWNHAEDLSWDQRN